MSAPPRALAALAGQEPGVGRLCLQGLVLQQGNCVCLSDGEIVTIQKY